MHCCPCLCFPAHKVAIIRLLYCKTDSGEMLCNQMFIVCRHMWRMTAGYDNVTYNTYISHNRESRHEGGKGQNDIKNIVTAFMDDPSTDSFLFLNGIFFLLARHSHLCPMSSGWISIRLGGIGPTATNLHRVNRGPDSQVPH
jgi:hypothetical protein